MVDKIKTSQIYIISLEKIILIFKNQTALIIKTKLKFKMLVREAFPCI